MTSFCKGDDRKISIGICSPSRTICGVLTKKSDSRSLSVIEIIDDAFVITAFWALDISKLNASVPSKISSSVINNGITFSCSPASNVMKPEDAKKSDSVAVSLIVW